MPDESTAQKWPSRRPSDDSFAALSALRRSAFKAQRDAIATVGSFPILQDGKVVYATEVQVPESEEHLTQKDVIAEYEHDMADLESRAPEMEAVASED